MSRASVGAWLVGVVVLILVATPPLFLDVVWQGLLVRVGYYTLLALSWNIGNRAGNHA